MTQDISKQEPKQIAQSEPQYCVSEADLKAMRVCDTSAALSADQPLITMGMVGNLARTYAQMLRRHSTPSSVSAAPTKRRSHGKRRK